MKLREFANNIGISYATALRMMKRGEIPGAYRLKTGTIVVPDESIKIISASGKNKINLNEFINLTILLGAEKLSNDDLQSLRIILEAGGKK